MKDESRTAEQHKVAYLLPWYLSDNLTGDEKQEVEEHLAGCGRCRNELAEVRSLRGDLKEAAGAQPGASAALFDRVRARLEVTESAEARSLELQSGGGWWNWMEDWLGRIFDVRWVPVAAVGIILAQLALFAGLFGFQAGDDATEFRTLSGASDPRGGPSKVQIRIAFREDAREKEIRDLLDKIGGRLVDGPSPAGFYRIAILGNSQNAPQTTELLARLRARTELVRFAEQVD